LKTDNQNANQNNTQTDSKYIKLLEKNNFDLQKELETKNNQIEALIAVINNLSGKGNQWTSSTRIPRAWGNNGIKMPIERLAKHEFESLIDYEIARQIMARNASERMKEFSDR